MAATAKGQLMARRVVCVSRTLGAGGEEIAQDVARELGFRYVDDEIVSRAAEKAGVSAEEIARAEHSQPLVARIMSASVSDPPGPATSGPAAVDCPRLPKVSRGNFSITADTVAQSV